jgi:hypothetical protein
VTPPFDREFEPGRHPDPRLCELHGSDAWLLVDALVSILVGLVTILLVVLRHLIRILFWLVVIGMIGTVAGWWVP